MSQHLSTQNVDRYRKLLMSPAELLAVDDHLAECETCCRMLGDPQQLESAFSRVRSELRATAGAKPEHLSYEQMAAFVDGEMTDVDLEIVKSHIEMCAPCTAEVRDLLAFKAVLANETESAVAASPVQPALSAPTRWQKFMASWRLPFHMSPLQAAGTAFVALLFLGVVAAVWLRSREMTSPTPTEVAKVERTPLMTEPTTANVAPTPSGPEDEQSNANLAQSNANLAKSNTNQSQAAATQQRPKAAPPPSRTLGQSPSQNEALALNDGGSRVTLDREGNARGLESLPPAYQRAVRQALATQSVETPSGLAELSGRSGTLMSGESSVSGVSFPVLGPVGTVVRSDRPLFRWGALAGATRYLVKVYDSNLRKVASSLHLSETEWTPAEPLARGGLYVWQVTATLKDGTEIIAPGAPAPEARFKVLERERADELNEAEQKYADSHLTLGLLYARSGLLEDAEREFQALVKANPDSTVARKLLRDVQAQRQSRR